MSKKQSKSESWAELAEAGEATPGALVGSPIQEAGRRINFDRDQNLAIFDRDQI